MSSPSHVSSHLATQQAGPMAYQHRARLLCPPCFAATRIVPRRFGACVLPIPPRRPVAVRPCAQCGVRLAIPGLFGLGRIAATTGALLACNAELVAPTRLLTRHWTGDWGEISPEDRGLNEDAIRDGTRIVSVYHLPHGAIVWLITEADRHATTLLVPDEY